jgi:hypothetical protein
MKNLKYIFLFFCITVTWSCKPEEFGPIVNSPSNVLQQMQGTWALTKVTQIDEAATKNGFPYKQIDITNIYSYKDLVLTIQGETTGAFTINPGNSPKISDIISGTWSVDNVQAPTTFILKNGTTTNNLTVGSYADLAKGKMYLIRTKSLNNKPVLSYKYEFTKK